MSLYLSFWVCACIAWDSQFEAEQRAEVETIAALLAASQKASARAWQRYRDSEQTDADRHRLQGKIDMIAYLMQDTSAKGRVVNQWLMSGMVG